MRRPERLFERYRRKGDLAALGTVFDRLAPGLLRIAMHFARDPAAAEDLLQETFLTAIEHAPRYDGARPLRPWLVGILRNHARQGWRQRSRDGTEALPADLAATAVKDPVDDLAWSRALSEQIGQLPAPMRQVLVLRLKHGMAPADIADLLDVAPATVRTRLHRGLARLRDTMPRESAPAALLLVPVAVGLPVVRTQVLAAASTAATATVAATSVGALTVPLLGGLVMTHKTLVIAAAIVLPLLGGGVAWMTGAFDAPDVPHETHVAVPIEGASEEDERAPELLVAERAPAPKDVAKPVEKPAEKAATPTQGASGRVPLGAPIPDDKGSVAGVVRFEDGTPLRNTPLALWGSPNVVSTTDDEGRYHIHADWVSDRSLFIKKEGEYQLIFAPTRMINGKLVTVDVTLVRGVDMRAQVVHADTRKPLKQVKVTLRRPHEERDTQAHAGFAKTDEAGRFLFEYLPKVKYTLELEHEGFTPELIHLDLKTDAMPTTLEMRPSTPLTIELAGAPDDVKGTQVRWHMQRLNTALSVSGRSEINGDGHLVIDDPGPGEYMFIIFKTDVMARVSEHITLKENTRRVTLGLPTYGGVVGSVRDRAGKVLAKTRLQIGMNRGQFVTTDADGNFALAKVPVGNAPVWVSPDGASIRSGSVEVVAGTDTRLDLVLRGGSEVNLRVLVDGVPASRHLASVVLMDTSGRDIVASGTPKSEGRIRIPHLTRGSYRLRVFSREAPAKEMPVELGIEQMLDLGDIGLSRFEEVPVRLAAPDGVATANVMVMVMNADTNRPMAGTGMGRLKLTPEGKVVLVGIGPGTHRLQVMANGCRPLKVDITLPYTGAEPLELDLEAQ